MVNNDRNYGLVLYLSFEMNVLCILGSFDWKCRRVTETCRYTNVKSLAEIQRTLGIFNCSTFYGVCIYHGCFVAKVKIETKPFLIKMMAM